MRFRFRSALRVFAPAVGLALFAAGCVTDRASSSDSGAVSGPARLPGAIGARWTAPDFATRIIDTERAATLDACVAAANALGYSVNRVDGALGRVSAARRQTSDFDGARQDTLDITVTTLGPGSAKVALTLRTAFESGSDDERAAGMVTTSLVRDRAPYEAFFARLAASIPAPAERPPAPTASAEAAAR